MTDKKYTVTYYVSERKDGEPPVKVGKPKYPENYVTLNLPIDEQQ